MRDSRRQFLTNISTATAGLAFAGTTAVRGSESKTRNVLVVTLDGFRHEEMFNGCESALLTKQAGVTDVEATHKDFWRESPQDRRAALLPFVWNVLVRDGQLFGNGQRNSKAILTNGKKFSYPGYNEMFTGAADNRIDSNNKFPNPNINVFEWLNQQEEFRGKVAAFGCWDVFPFILNRERAGIPVHAGWEPLPGPVETEASAVLNRLMLELPREWGNSHYDALAFEAAIDYLKTHKPRVLYIGFGETDEYAHEGKYDRYLQAAHRSDGMLGRLWQMLQTMPEYRGTTSLLITTDHGRGGLPDGWKNHGANVEGAENIWIGVLGPDTPPLGERSDTKVVTQSQVAATIAALLGKDFRLDREGAASPISEVLSA
jgi:hypothetical protein